MDPQSSDAARGDTVAAHASDCDVPGPGGGYRFSDEKGRIDVAAVHRYLSKVSSWAK